MDPENAESAKERPTVSHLSGLSADDLVTLNEEIAGMARAGLPLDQGLAALAREMGSGRLQRATSEIATDLQAGRTLPEALERQVGRVPPFYVALVGIGVRSGRLADVLATLTTYARSIADLRSLVAGAVLYPVVVLVLAFLLFAFVAWQIVPRFTEIFVDFGIELPIATQIAVEIGQHPIEFLVLPPAGVLLGLLLTKVSLRGSESGRRAWARMIYAMPLIGSLVRSSRLAAFTDLLALLVEHGVPLPEAFRMAGEASSDPLMAHASRELAADLAEGKPLGEALRSRQLVPEFIAWMTGLGERRGTLAFSLSQSAEVYRRQAANRAHVLRTLLPPLLVVGTAGGVIGFFVVALFMPLINLLSALSG